MGLNKKIAALAASGALVLTMAPQAFAQDDGAPKPPYIETANNPKADYGRISGMNRFEVSVNAAKLNDKAGVTVPGLYIISSGMVFPDALTSVPLTDQINASSLLIPGNTLGSEVRDYISRGPSKVGKGAEGQLRDVVFIIGGEGSVSPNVVKELKKINPQLKVVRIGGANRYEVAYHVAAWTSAFTKGGSAELMGKYQDWSSLVAAEQRYQDALMAYEAARADFAAKKAAYDRAEKAVADKIAEIKEVGKGIVSADVDAARAAVDAATVALGKANAELNKGIVHQKVLVDLLSAQDPQGVTTYDLDSTLAKYKAGFPALANAIEDARIYFGLSNSTKLGDAIAISNTKVDQLQADVEAKSTDLSKAAAKLAEEMQKAAGNKELQDKLAKLGAELVALEAKSADAKEAMDKAKDVLDAARIELTRATRNRPDPGAIDGAWKAYLKFEETVIRSNAVPSFLATGRVFSDALSTGPAAAQENSVLLLTEHDQLGMWAKKYLDLSNAETVAVGGDAIAAIGTNTNNKIAGANRYEIAYNVAKKYFGNRNNVAGKNLAVASGEIFSDALVAGSFISQYDGALLLTAKNVVPFETDNALRGLRWRTVGVVGGPATITESTAHTIYLAAMNK